MAQTKRIQVLRAPLEAKAGALHRVYDALRKDGVDMIAGWGYEMGGGKAEGIFYAKDGAKAKASLEKLGLGPQAMEACYAQGDDAPGVYAELLGRIAKAGVNLTASDAFGIGGKFAAIFFAEEKDLPALAKALGC